MNPSSLCFQILWPVTKPYHWRSTIWAETYESQVHSIKNGILIVIFSVFEKSLIRWNILMNWTYSTVNFINLTVTWWLFISNFLEILNASRFCENWSKIFSKTTNWWNFFFILYEGWQYCTLMGTII